MLRRLQSCLAGDRAPARSRSRRPAYTGEKAMDKQTKKVTDAGKVRIGGYSPPVVKPASVQDSKKVRTGGMSPSF